MKLIDKDALSMELMNEVLNAYAKADFRFAHALNVFQGLIDKAPTVEERKHGHWEDIDLDTSVCSVCKKPQEYETKYCPECGAKMENNGKPIKNEQLGYECNVFDLFIHDATKAFVNAEFKLKIGVILPVADSERGRL